MSGIYWKENFQCYFLTMLWTILKNMWTTSSNQRSLPQASESYWKKFVECIIIISFKNVVMWISQLQVAVYEGNFFFNIRSLDEGRWYVLPYSPLCQKRHQYFCHPAAIDAARKPCFFWAIRSMLCLLINIPPNNDHVTYFWIRAWNWFYSWLGKVTLHLVNETNGRFAVRGVCATAKGFMSTFDRQDWFYA